MLLLVSDSEKMAQPSGIVARAAFRSSSVQLIRSPTTLVAPAMVLMANSSKIWKSLPSCSAALNTRSISWSRPRSGSLSI